MPRSAVRTTFLFYVGFLFLTACAGVGGTTPTATSLPSPSQTTAPTVTPTPPPPTLLLIAPQGEETPWFSEASAVLEEFARQEGLRFEVKPTIGGEELQSLPVPLVVILPAEIDPKALAEAAPRTQFLAVGYPSLSPQPNLSLISAQPYRPDWEGFIAGFVAAAVTEDWRVGVVADATTPEGKAAQNAFRNGVRYLCGLCQPLYPPFPVPTYPLYGQLSAASTAAEVEHVIADFQTWAVKTVYLHRPAEQWLTAFGRAGFNLISDQPPPTELKDHWVVSIQNIDFAAELRTLIPQLLEGQGGQSLSLSLTFGYVNEDLFSPGRQAFSEQMIAELLSGYIDSGVDPISGEFRE
ncbi:MAG: hypothetical protein Kow0088_17380 [Anaerolineales bacterium]